MCHKHVNNVCGTFEADKDYCTKSGIENLTARRAKDQGNMM